MKTALRAADPVIMLEPKALFASKGEVPVGRALRSVRRRRASREPAPTSPSSPPARWCSVRSRRPTRLRRKASSAEVIDLTHDHAARHRDHRREREEDASPARRRRGLGDVRPRRRDRPGDQRTRLRRARRPSGPAAHGADVASLRPVLERAMLVDAAQDRAGRARRHRRPAAGARSLVHGRHQAAPRRQGRRPRPAPKAAAPAPAQPAAAACRQATTSRSPCRSAI